MVMNWTEVAGQNLAGARWIRKWIPYYRQQVDRGSRQFLAGRVASPSISSEKFLVGNIVSNMQNTQNNTVKSVKFK